MLPRDAEGRVASVEAVGGGRWRPVRSQCVVGALQARASEIQIVQRRRDASQYRWYGCDRTRLGGATRDPGGRPDELAARLVGRVLGVARGRPIGLIGAQRASRTSTRARGR